MRFIQKALQNLAQRSEGLHRQCLLPATVHLRQQIMWIRYIIERIEKYKHSDMENTKLRLWGKLIEKGRYDDLDNLPQIPLITGSPVPAKKKRNNLSTALVDAATVVTKAYQTSHTSTTVTTDGSPVRHSMPTGHLEPPSKLSPFKYAQLHLSCLEDLKSLKHLYQDNVFLRLNLLKKRHESFLLRKHFRSVYCPIHVLCTPTNLIMLHCLIEYQKSEIKLFISRMCYPVFKILCSNCSACM